MLAGQGGLRFRRFGYYCPGRRLALVYRRRERDGSPSSSVGLEMKYSDFIPLLYPGETLPSDGVRLPTDNLRNAYTVN